MCTRVCVFNFLPFSIIQLRTMQYNDYIASCFPLELYQWTHYHLQHPCRLSSNSQDAFLGRLRTPNLQAHVSKRERAESCCNPVKKVNFQYCFDLAQMEERLFHLARTFVISLRYRSDMLSWLTSFLPTDKSQALPFHPNCVRTGMQHKETQPKNSISNASDGKSTFLPNSCLLRIGNYDCSSISFSDWAFTCWEVSEWRIRHVW